MRSIVTDMRLPWVAVCQALRQAHTSRALRASVSTNGCCWAWSANQPPSCARHACGDTCDLPPFSVHSCPRSGARARTAGAPLLRGAELRWVASALRGVGCRLASAPRGDQRLGGEAAGGALPARPGPAFCGGCALAAAPLQAAARAARGAARAAAGGGGAGARAYP